MVRDMDPPGPSGWRLEVVADGLPLFHGAQLAIDTTLVSFLRCLPPPRWVRKDVAAARRRKERTYPEFTGQFGRAIRGVRWRGGSGETQAFLRQFAKEPVPQQARARQHGS